MEKTGLEKVQSWMLGSGYIRFDAVIFAVVMLAIGVGGHFYQRDGIFTFVRDEMKTYLF